MQVEASNLPAWAKQISSVKVVPTVQLLADVPRAATEEVFIHLGIDTVRQAVKGNHISEWWDPAKFPETLQSAIVTAANGQGKPKMCLLMADSRQSLWDESKERYMHLGKTTGDMYVLPAMINMLYAVQQGYDFVHFRIQPEQAARHPAWSKLLALRAVLPKYLFVLYLDSDAFVRPPGAAHLLETIVGHAGLNSGKVMAVTKEAPKYPDVANTGMMVLRSCPEAVRMLEDWWLSIVRHRMWSGYRTAWPFEQGAFTKIIYPQYNNSITLLDMLEYNSPEGLHIQHMWSVLKDAEREEAFVHAASAVMHQIEDLHDKREHHDATPVELAQQLVRVVDEVMAMKRT